MPLLEAHVEGIAMKSSIRRLVLLAGALLALARLLRDAALVVPNQCPNGRKAANATMRPGAFQ
jgi:hypothetical protein